MPKKEKKSQAEKAGRKIFDGKDEQVVLAKCKEVWAIGGTDQEAAFYAEISPSSLSRYLDAHEELKEFRNQLQEKPILKARQTIVKSLDDPTNAKWYLERKKKNEFADSKLEEKTQAISNTYNFLFNPQAQAEIRLLEEKIKERLLNVQEVEEDNKTE